MDVAKLIRSLEAHKVYTICPGRTFDNEDDPAVHAEVVGLQKLMNGQGSGLNEYNRLFKSTQDVHRQPIVSKMVPHTSLPRQPPQAPVNQADQGFMHDNTEPAVTNEAEDLDLEPEDDECEDDEGKDRGEGEDEGEDVGDESESESESVDSLAREATEDFQMDDYEDIWPAHEEESWLDDLAIFDD